MTTFPGTPKVQKGAIIGVDQKNPLASIVLFQYNPDNLSRSLKAATSEGEGGQSEAFRVSGPPEETITLDIEIDASDQLEAAEPQAVNLGIYPQLASLEMLLYPKAASVIANNNRLGQGEVEIIPPEGPLTLFVWGAKRVLPVRLTAFTITEEAFDPKLNPIRAKVNASMRVLNYQDLGLDSKGGALFMAHQLAKEAMAAIGGLTNISDFGSFGIDL